MSFGSPSSLMRREFTPVDRSGQDRGRLRPGGHGAEPSAMAEEGGVRFRS